MQEICLCFTLFINIRAVKSSFFSRFMLWTFKTRYTELSDRIGSMGRGDACFDAKVLEIIFVDGCLGVSCLGVSNF